MNELPAHIHRTLLRSGLTLATAESCTGGWVAKLFTDRSGASNYFKGALVVYTNAMKRKLLGVRISDASNAVQRRTAIDMARQTLRKTGADLAVSTTGFMEPPGEQAAEFKRRKITGISFIAVAYRQGAKTAVRWERFILRGTRRQNRVSTSTAAVHLIVKTLPATAKRTGKKGAPREHFIERDHKHK